MKKVVVVMVLVVIMSYNGRSQTDMLLEDTKIENHFVFMSEKDIENVFKNGQIEWATIESIDGQCYVKKCLITDNNNSFSEILLTSEIFGIDNQKVRIECVYIEVCYYDSRVLYVRRGSKKLWWHATNLLNSAELSVLE
jgi:hypothetical protein